MKNRSIITRPLLATLFLMTTAALTLAAQLPTAVKHADFYDNGRPSPAKVELGRLLFFDKILSGNKNIACATCHHPTLGASDGLALPLGEGARGLGLKRKVGETITEAVFGRVPRNSPALFNLGAREFQRLFHDGRVEVDRRGYYDSGFITPARWKLPAGLDNVLAAQAMFPVTSPIEMAGERGENPIADAVAVNNVARAWDVLGRRLQANPTYVELFQQAFPEKVRRPEDVSYVLAANAIAAFETHAFRADNSPFDYYLRGQVDSLSEDAKRGMELFYGEAGCSGCHAGKFQTDHEFHAIAMPQVGPGKGDGSDDSYWRATGINAALEDFGRGRVTLRSEDRYKFRTPSLRNVALTGPWGHAGAYDTLEAVVRHHLDPVASLNRYAASSEQLPPLARVVELTALGSTLRKTPLVYARQIEFLKRDAWVHENVTLRGYIAHANELQPHPLNDKQVRFLITFLDSLTDPSVMNLDLAIPTEVPSGLPVSD